ncbi:helix-turn-helix transcriptional regulator [Staphylococcus felis]|uniref:helix-turn-helix transcriptional regulator n=1 Tax=Staphylococcus felis TaxID=46127 RepID=UPI0015F25C39|nr:helix-turn-helix transcriptional regulator [Staphylococcus felis]
MKIIFTNIYYLNTPMNSPKRCMDGVVIILSVVGKIKVKIDGEMFNNHNIYIINDSCLYQIYSDSVILVYFPSSIFTKYDINIFDKNFTITNHEETRNQLIGLFNHYKSHKHTTVISENSLKKVLFLITKEEVLNKGYPRSLLNNIMIYISHNIHSRITLATLSQEFYVSKSSISSLFKKDLNISFYDYISSLKISKSMKEITLTDKKIKTIANHWNYPSATNYIMHFKKFTKVTPKKYRSLSIGEKHLYIDNLKNGFTILKKLSVNKFPEKKKTEIKIKNQDINQEPFTYFNLIDIGGFENLDSITNEKIFYYKNFSNFKLSSYIYISDPIDKIIETSFDKIVIRLRSLLKTNISIALKITDIEQYEFITKLIKELHFLESEHLSSSSIQRGSILLLLDLNHVSLSKIKNIHRNIYGTKILISVDITKYYKKNTILSDSIVNLKPDFYTIDFGKESEDKLLSNDEEAFRITHLKLNNFLGKIDARKNIIFLDYESLYMPKFLNNISAFLNHSIRSRYYVAGANIYFTTLNKHGKKIAIFDETENKTPFYFLGIMLLNFSRYPCYYGENYLITKNPHSYNILIYNPESSPISNNNEDARNFHISFFKNLLSPEILISTELLNNTHGSIKSIINNIEDLKSFPNSLKYKISQYNSPFLKVEKHNFNISPYIVEVPPKSVMLITIYC